MVLGYELIKKSELERILLELDCAIERAEVLSNQVKDSDFIIGELRQIRGLLAGQQEKRWRRNVVSYSTLAASVSPRSPLLSTHSSAQVGRSP